MKHEYLKLFAYSIQVEYWDFFSLYRLTLCLKTKPIALQDQVHKNILALMSEDI